MTVHKELIVPVADLRRLAVECAECQTVVLMDLGQNPVTFCPVCRRDYDLGFSDRIRALANAIAWLARSKECRFTFRVPPSGETPKE